ncbi:uncharacterized protein orion isoform X1 [Halyomorpha halys]|uniref:uncharacterized protein orion isoform X1 n=1 Tax=Halyomorpha halys TaxID=286706 RepID=UPI0006D4FD00|nr:uncharacterized protein LOC106689384 isoform X1 [Halyomorpha halys]
MWPWARLLCCLLFVGHVNGGFLQVVSVASLIVKSIWNVWMVTDAVPDYLCKDDRGMKAKLRTISRQLDAAESRLHASEDIILREIYSVPSEIKYEMKLNKLLDTVLQVERVEKIFEDYMEVGLKDHFNSTKVKLENHTIMDFLDTIISHHPGSVRANMDTIHQMIVVDDSRTMFLRSGVFSTLLKYIKEADEHICEAEMSPQQLLYNLFSILQLSQLKAYTMINFSWLLLRLYNKGNFTTEAKMLHDNYLERMSQQANALKESMKRADASFWRCDPRIHEEDKTYTEVTKLLQGFLVNEVDLNKEVTCREDCPFYKYTKQYTCYKDNYCAKQPRCNGNVVDCQFVDSDMWVCQAPSQSSRRYDWIRYENGRTLGSMGSCSRPIAKVDSWWRWLFWHCSFCMCYCDDPNTHQSDRYFNLRAVTSDKANNKVVTGIRFTKVNRIIHLQVQEGELLPLGGINETTIQWKPVEDYNIDDKGVTVGVDYHMLTWEGRAIDLDDIKVPQDCVVTGVKLRRVGGHLNLEVEGAQFNFTTGKLIQSGEKSFWSSNDKTDVSAVNPRTQLKLKKPDIPTRTVGASHIDSKSEQFVEFGPTDLDLDAGQTTIPFLDTQLVAPQPPVPLAGIGIYHKGRDYSGGYIAPKVITYDFSKHIMDHFPEINEAS